MTSEEHSQPPATDTYKQVAVAQPATIEHNGEDCMPQVNGRDCTLEPSDRDCTLEVNRRVEDSNKEAVGQTQTQAHESGGQTEADETGNQGNLENTSRKSRRHRYSLICAVVAGFVLLIVIIVPSVVATKH